MYISYICLHEIVFHTWIVVHGQKYVLLHVLLAVHGQRVYSVINTFRKMYFFSFYRVKGGDWSETNVFRSTVYVIKTFVSFHV